MNISMNPNVIKNIFIGAQHSPEVIKIYTNLFNNFEMYSLDIMKKCRELILQQFIKIKTYEKEKSVQENIWPVNPQKVVAVKVDAKKLLMEGTFG